MVTQSIISEKRVVQPTRWLIFQFRWKAYGMKTWINCFMCFLCVFSHFWCLQRLITASEISLCSYSTFTVSLNFLQGQKIFRWYHYLLNPQSMHWSVSLVYLYIINGARLRMACAVCCCAVSKLIIAQGNVQCSNFYDENTELFSWIKMSFSKIFSKKVWVGEKKNKHILGFSFSCLLNTSFNAGCLCGCRNIFSPPW